VEHLQIVDLSPHLGHKLIAAAELRCDYIGLIVDPGDSVDGISTMLFGLYDDKKIKAMRNPERVDLISPIVKSKKRKGKTITLPPTQKKLKGPPPKSQAPEEDMGGDEDDEDGSQSPIE
jgi:hypothetical protein